LLTWLKFHSKTKTGLVGAASVKYGRKLVASIDEQSTSLVCYHLKKVSTTEILVHYVSNDRPAYRPTCYLCIANVLICQSVYGHRYITCSTNMQQNNLKRSINILTLYTIIQSKA